jgi:gamma-glutamyltranspeptidase/glutathione hydrolase
VRSFVSGSTVNRAPRRAPAYRGPVCRSLAALLSISLATSGCSTLGSVKNTLFGAPTASTDTPGQVSGFLGAVVADEPQAALIGRNVLAAGGDAADAAVAMGFALAVTLPSRAGLGGGGGCVVYAAGSDGRDRNAPGGVANAILFPPRAPASAAGSDRPAAVPMLARGLYLLHARYGSRPFETLVTPAEQMARFGTPVSRAFARDIAVVAGPLAADPGAGAIFTRNGQPLPEGTTLVQPDLSATLAQIRIAGVGDLYQGALGRRLVQAAAAAGGTMSLADLREALPQAVPALTEPAGHDDVAAFLPPPPDGGPGLDGGLADAAAFRVLRANPAALDQANARALGVATRWRQGGIDAASLLAGPVPPPALPALPASTSFAALDRKGNAVACAVSMDNLFGTGRIAPGTGVLLAASPAATPAPLLSAALIYNPNLKSFRAAIGASGQEGAPLAAAIGLVQATGAAIRPTPQAAPDPGRLNIIACPGYLPGDQNSCRWATDPRGAGLAIGSN